MYLIIYFARRRRKKIQAVDRWIGNRFVIFCGSVNRHRFFQVSGSVDRHSKFAFGSGWIGKKKTLGKIGGSPSGIRVTKVVWIITCTNFTSVGNCRLFPADAHRIRGGRQQEHLTKSSCWLLALWSLSERCLTYFVQLYKGCFYSSSYWFFSSLHLSDKRQLRFIFFACS